MYLQDVHALAQDADPVGVFTAVTFIKAARGHQVIEEARPHIFLALMEVAERGASGYKL